MKIIAITALMLTATTATASDKYVTHAELTKVDREDHRLKAGYVQGDTLVLVTEDQPRGQTRRRVKVDVSSLKGSNGKDAVAPLGALSLAAASASFTGDGIGFGLAVSNYSKPELSVVLGFTTGDRSRITLGLTANTNDQYTISAGLGFNF